MTISHRMFVISSVLLILLGMVGGIAFAITTHFAGASESGETVTLSDVQEDIVKRMYDSSGKFTDSDDKMASAASDNEGGFGGYYFDENDPSTVYVYMKDTTRTTEAEQALRAALYKDSQYTNIVPVLGKYAMDDLVSWHRQLLASLSDGRIDNGTTFIAHESNAFHVDVVNESDMAAVWALVDELSIPRGAVILEVGGEWELLLHDDKSHLSFRQRHS